MLAVQTKPRDFDHFDPLRTRLKKRCAWLLYSYDQSEMNENVAPYVCLEKFFRKIIGVLHSLISYSAWLIWRHDWDFLNQRKRKGSNNNWDIILKNISEIGLGLIRSMYRFNWVIVCKERKVVSHLKKNIYII